MVGKGEVVEEEECHQRHGTTLVTSGHQPWHRSNFERSSSLIRKSKETVFMRTMKFSNAYSEAQTKPTITHLTNFDDEHVLECMEN